MLKRLAEGLEEIRCEVGSAQLTRFHSYQEELTRWNDRMNLTAITDPAEVETRHFLDSVTPLLVLREQTQPGSALSLIDVGSGAGFPGIPLKLVLPEMRVVLLEATGKKAEFLRHMVGVLQLADTEVVQGRAEEVAHDQSFRESFDVAIARAVAPLPSLIEICLPFVRVGGLFVAMKKGDIQAEVQGSRTALSAVGGGELRLIEVPLRQLPDSRFLVCVAKASPSPDRYPRRTGIPFKRPL